MAASVSLGEKRPLHPAVQPCFRGMPAARSTLPTEIGGCLL